MSDMKGLTLQRSNPADDNSQSAQNAVQKSGSEAINQNTQSPKSPLGSSINTSLIRLGY